MQSPNLEPAQKYKNLLSTDPAHSQRVLRNQGQPIGSDHDRTPGSLLGVHHVMDATIAAITSGANGTPTLLAHQHMMNQLLVGRLGRKFSL